MFGAPAVLNFNGLAYGGGIGAVIVNNSFSVMPQIQAIVLGPRWAVAVNFAVGFSWTSQQVDTEDKSLPQAQ